MRRRLPFWKLFYCRDTHRFVDQTCRKKEAVSGNYQAANYELELRKSPKTFCRKGTRRVWAIKKPPLPWPSTTEHTNKVLVRDMPHAHTYIRTTQWKEQESLERQAAGDLLPDHKLKGQ